ncbi:protein of unknown function [Marinitoga hydrogenitolerans DSM 16785]|uniref:DUF4382 domain-containing protein n=1 Tax=Marinitoga hydrogenitolerans (strain DSM 16785 / JCM 12826 / AT1271) TaxID=1122195 RepID=A0A1M4W3Z1_MARH1|nr:DUF4382 domain-containing protein [Marinitoga hydrogenitolerans]SHE75917.1 protein of unknown function [Marinitoga hydrogenitolerans DSM 16785]
MKKRTIIFLSLFFILTFIFVGCVSNLNDEQSLEKATVSVLLTDRPVSDVDGLLVFIKDVYFTYEINGEFENSTPVEINKEYDILTLAGTETHLFDFELPVNAQLESIHMNVSNIATVVIGGNEYSVSVNGSGESDLENYSKITIPNVGITISDDGELVIDFDVVRSLKQVGNPLDNSYKLTPVLKPTFRRRHATDIFLIKGNIVDSTNNNSPVAGAVVTLSSTSITGDSTILRVTLSNDEGNFCLGKFENGEYDIKVYTNLEFAGDNSEINFDNEISDYATTIQVNSDNIDLNIKLGQ